MTTGNKILLGSGILVLASLLIYLKIVSRYNKALKSSIISEVAPIIDNIFDSNVPDYSNVEYTETQTTVNSTDVTQNAETKKYSYIDPLTGQTVIVDIARTIDPSAYTITYFDTSVNKYVTVRVAVKRV